MPGGLAADGQLVLEAGFPSLTLATVNDARFALDLPLDRSAAVNWDNIEGQSALIAGVLSRAIDDPALLEGVAELKKALEDQLRDLRVFPLIAAVNSLKLAEVVPGSKRKLFWGMALALILSLIGATWIILTICYEHGGINLHPFFMTH